MSDQEYVRQRIQLHVALAEAVDQVIESAEPIGAEGDEEGEYAVDGEAYQQMFNCFVALKNQQKGK